MRPAAHHRLYQKNPTRYRDITRSVFLRLDPFKDLYARVEFLNGDEVAVDLLLKDPTAEARGIIDKQLTPIHTGSRLSIMELDGDRALHDAVRRVKGKDPSVRQSLERLQEALLEELITG
ncbi:MAG: hypothetical protein ACE5Z5_10315 [Candidatus Bathyarchaeia archaeon]